MADPKVNPNALGAPTEGFGQTVSFAFDPRGVTPPLALAKSQPHGVGASGVSSPQGTNPAVANQPVRKDGTADLLMRMGEEIFRPHLEKAKNAQYIKGMQQAMAGAAVADMAKEQPWYSRLFGDTPMMEGARTYEVFSKVNGTVQAQTADMDRLKTMGPQEAQSHFARVMEQSMTGDASSDTLIAKGLMDAMPGLMKAQAKAHYGWGQQRAVDAMSKSMAQAGDTLQQYGQQFADDTINDKDMAVLKRSSIQAIQPPDGINEENFGKVLTGSLKGWAQRGHFHAIEAVRESGGFEALSPEQQNSVNAAVMAAATKHRDNYAFQFVKEIAELRSDAANPASGQTPEQLVQRYKRMNERYVKLTGSPVGLFTSDEVAAGAAGTINAIKTEQARADTRQQVLNDKAADAAEKERARAEETEAVRKYLSQGDVMMAARATKASKDEIDMQFAAMFKSGKPDSASFLIRQNFVRGDGYVNPILKAEFSQDVRMAEGRGAPSDQFYQALQRYEEMKAGDGGMALAQAYHGEFGLKLEKFSRMTAGYPNGEMDAQAWTAAFDRTDVSKPQPLGTKEVAALAKSVAGNMNDRVPEFLGGKFNLRPDALDYLSQLAEPAVEDWRGVPTVTDKEAVAHGIASAVLSRRVELIGGYAVDRSDVNAGPTLREIGSAKANIPDGSHNEFFAMFLRSKGVDEGGTTRIMKTGDRYTVTTMVDGVPKMRQFTPLEWTNFAAAATLDRTTKLKSGEVRIAGNRHSLAFGPAITYKADASKPSIYASRAERAAWGLKEAAEARKRRGDNHQ